MKVYIWGRGRWPGTQETSQKKETNFSLKAKARSGGWNCESLRGDRARGGKGPSEGESLRLISNEKKARKGVFKGEKKFRSIPLGTNLERRHRCYRNQKANDTGERPYGRGLPLDSWHMNGQARAFKTGDKGGGRGRGQGNELPHAEGVGKKGVR